MSGARLKFSLLVIAALAAFALLAHSAHAQSGLGRGGYRPPAPTTEAIPELEGVTIEDKTNALLPLDAVLVDEQGKPHTLREILSKDRPTVLQIGYMRCPQLCSLVMNALVRSMRQLDWSVGQEYEVISLSINPEEKHELAAGKKAGYVAEYGRGTSGNGWHFLTGEQQHIHAVADAVGFKYRRQENGEYSHAAAIFLITPDGRLSRAMYGVEYPMPTLRMGLLEASEGKIGSTIDRFILWCHIYNPTEGGYVLFAMRLMQLGGAITVAVLGGGLLWFWRRELLRRRLAPTAHLTPATLGGHK